MEPLPLALALMAFHNQALRQGMEVLAGEPITLDLINYYELTAGEQLSVQMSSSVAGDLTSPVTGSGTVLSVEQIA